MSQKVCVWDGTGQPQCFLLASGSWIPVILLAEILICCSLSLSLAVAAAGFFLKSTTISTVPPVDGLIPTRDEPNECDVIHELQELYRLVTGGVCVLGEKQRGKNAALE